MQSSNSVEIAPGHTAPDRRVGGYLVGAIGELPEQRRRAATLSTQSNRSWLDATAPRSQQGALLTRNRSLLLLLVVTILATALVASASGAKTIKLGATLNGKQEVAKQTTASSARGSFSATLSG